MYEEKKIKIPFRDIALQLIVIVLFVLALLWFFPAKKIMKGEDNNSNNKQSTEKNTNKNNDTKETNSSSKKTSSDKKDEKKAKQYEYAKTSEVEYGEYGPWSEWSTTYVAPSDTVEVQTEVRNSITGWKKDYVQTGTQTNTNVVVGTKTDSKVITGYNVEFVRNMPASTEPRVNFDDYLYVLTSAYKKYKCEDGSIIKQEVIGAPITPDNLTYDYLKTQNGDLSGLNPPANCVNPSVPSYSSDPDDPDYEPNPEPNEQYNYALYRRVPIYTTVTEDIYGDVTSPVYSERTENTYGDVTYYRFRKRSYKAGSDSIKWSDSENDETLISQGYHFTGNVK